MLLVLKFKIFIGVNVNGWSAFGPAGDDDLDADLLLSIDGNTYGVAVAWLEAFGGFDGVLGSVAQGGAAIGELLTHLECELVAV